MKHPIYQMIVMISLAVLLAACGPSAAELAQQATQTAAELAAIQTAEAPTVTPTNTVTPTPTFTIIPSPTPTPSPTPESENPTLSTDNVRKEIEITPALKIIMVRSTGECWGGCRPYEISIFGDGRVIFRIYEKGIIEKQIEKEQLRQIVTAFQNTNFIAITSIGEGNMPYVFDAGFLYIAIETGGKVYELIDHGACNTGYHGKFCDLGNTIDKIMGTPWNIPKDRLFISSVIQGDWITAQVYDLAGEQTWITGTLTMRESYWEFEPTSKISGTPMDETLNFLIDHPEASVKITYPPGVNPKQFLADFSPGDILATVEFRDKGEVIAEFTIRMRDFYSLELITPSGAFDLWSVIKQIQ